MIARARRDDAAGAFAGCQVRNLVVGAAQLEAENRLQILALEEDRVADAAREAGRRSERRLTRHVVDTAREDVMEKRREREGQSDEYIVRIVRAVRVVRIVRIVLDVRIVPSVRGRNEFAIRSAIKRAAVNVECGVATTRRRPAATASQMAAGFGSASTSEYVVPSCSSRCTSPLPTSGLPCRCAHCSANTLKFTARVNLPFHSTASNRCAYRV